MQRKIPERKIYSAEKCRQMEGETFGSTCELVDAKFKPNKF